MTTKYYNTTGIPLYTFRGSTFCKMVDVLKLLHHEMYENDDKKIRDVLNRIEMRLSKNAIISTDQKKPEQLQEDKMPCRYAVGYHDCNGAYHFYMGSKDGKALYSKDYRDALRYKDYKSAECCADFLDEEAASVLDMEGVMTEEERWVRAINMPMPYNADDGNENAIPVEVVI